MNEKQQGIIAIIGIIIAIIVAAVVTVNIMSKPDIEPPALQETATTVIGGNQTNQTNPYHNDTIVINDLELNVSNTTTTTTTK